MKQLLYTAAYTPLYSSPTHAMGVCSFHSGRGYFVWTLVIITADVSLVYALADYVPQLHRQVHTKLIMYAFVSLYR